ncbi:hypothetical protein ACIP98_22970 [Streptomyces sp. NPDC088354]|uniref:hypothetical protein n=1 Tax=unclassified Streptomyces TaxID=2593676 RepID=UPI0029B6D2A3|nr:hypothetical protein [Streptomyces sp. MI02-7b]MDX3073072.1 hypothetical protein [Streptomyces sp. MI02-7b]
MKRTIALLATPLAASAALAFSPAVMSQAAAAPTQRDAAATASHDRVVPSLTATQRGFQQGNRDGLSDAQQGAPGSCNAFGFSFSPREAGQDYRVGYRNGYNNGWTQICDLP